MPRFCANLTLLFTEVPLADRFSAARNHGFGGVEVLFPGELGVAGCAQRVDSAGLPLALLNCPVDTPDPATFGSAANPERRTEFNAELERALSFAERLRPDFVHLMAGRTTAADWRDVFCENLQRATQKAPWQTFTIEPLNTFDVPEYALCDFDTALEIIEDVAATNLRLQFDTYHAHRITGDIIGTWHKVCKHTAHIQIGGIPDRHEPLDGEFHYSDFFSELDRTGYKGWVSGEYHPKHRTEDGLSWLRAL